MNILFMNIFFVGFMVSEIPRVSVFGHCPYPVTSPYVVRVDVGSHSNSDHYRPPPLYLIVR